MRRLVVPTLSLGLLLGCETNTNLTVTFVIPVDVMASIPATEYPQQVGFGTSMHSGATWAVCAPDDTNDFVVTVEDSAEGCVQEPLVIDVVMGPFVPPSTGCVAERADPFSALSTQDVITATGSGMAFEDANSATCITREEEVEITLSATGT